MRRSLNGNYDFYRFIYLFIFQEIYHNACPPTKHDIDIAIYRSSQNTRLDSRMGYPCMVFAFGYTFGPCNLAGSDTKNAKQFSQLL